MLITLDSVVDFINDEGLGPVKIKNGNDPERWQVSINEPPQFGTNDKQFRCGIAIKEIKGNKTVIFNAYKASATIGDEFHGGWYKFVKLVKGFNSIQEAKDYFNSQYVGNISDVYQYYNKKLPPNNDPTIQPIEIPDDFERFDPVKHEKYFHYLRDERKIPSEIIHKLRLFVNKGEQRIIFPVYENNKLIFYSGRDITGFNPYPWKKSEGDDKHPIWNLDSIIGNVVYVFEGINDAVYIQNGIALFGVGTEKQFEKILKKQFNKIVLVFDNDIPGRKAKYKWAEWLREKNHSGIYIYNYFGIKQKDFGKMVEENIQFELNERIHYWDYNTRILFNLRRVI